MDCPTPPLIRLLAAWLGPILLAQTPVAHSENAQLTPLVRAFRNDAALHAIAFANSSSGWAVGDRGVIWHTDDGGANWRQQTAPVTSTLQSVFFINARRGWAAGGFCQPGADATRSVVLRTDDGGTTWLKLPQPLLPLLAGVKFFDRDRGIAFGQSASFYPSGVFATHDGGENWRPLPADQPGSWLAGDFLEPDAGALAGPMGQVATLARRKIVASPLAAASLRSIRAMQLAPPTTGWAVGDGGLLLTTNDLGHSWQTPPTALPESISRNFDFHALAVQGSHVWVAGVPGTRIFHSPDRGKSWQAAATGQTAPLRALAFIDDQHGWATGEFGNILATRDGGKSWQTQRTGAQRAALLAIVANPDDIPLEMLADYGAAAGYVTATNIICTPNAPGEPASAGGQRTREALLLAGAATANTDWQFPLPASDLALEPEDLIAALNRENDGRAIQQLQNHVVRELRMWRPDVVVISHSPKETRDGPIAALIEQIVARAANVSAQSAQRDDLESGAGLAPWQIKKVYGLTAPGTPAEESIESERFSPWLGATLADFIAPARSLLSTTHTPPASTLNLKMLMSQIPANNNARGLFSGIALAPGCDARRPQPDPPVQDDANLRRLALRRKSLQQLLQRTEGNAAWTAQVNQMLDGLSDDDCAQLLVQLAESYRKTGRLDLAADTYFLFARRTPDHPLVDSALTWLIEFYASDEVAHRLAARAATNIRSKTDHSPNGEPAGDEVASLGLSSSKAAGGVSGIQQTSAVSPLDSTTAPTVNLSRDDRLHRAIQLADYLKTTRPALYAEPAIRFAEVSAQRRLGYANPAKRYFLSLRQLPEADPWRQCAAIEEWLNSHAEPAPTGKAQGEDASQLPPAKKIATCRRVVQPPHLDGQLNEPCWDSADRLPLDNSDSRPRAGKGSADEHAGAELRIAHDNEFLYVAIRCPKLPSLDYRADDSPRPRDSDLTRHDRVSIRLDIDRDYTTAFELTVDHRGWTHDACWRDASWNPTWFVAAASDDTSWTAEAAIPLAELVTNPPATRDVWALSARRTIPRTGYQSWAGESTSNDSPSTYGLLIFE